MMAVATISETKRRGKGRRIRKRPAAPVPANDATPERIAQAGGHSTVVEARIEKFTDRPAKARQFADAPIDRMRRQERLTYAQWYAGNWYREQYEMSGLPGVKAQNLNRTGVGECAYGMPISERQARCRSMVRRAREIIGDRMVRLIEPLIIEETTPQLLNGRQRERYAATIGRALDPLADWLGAM